MAIYPTPAFLSKGMREVWECEAGEIREIRGCSSGAGHPQGVFTNLHNNSGLEGIRLPDSESWAFTPEPETPWTAGTPLNPRRPFTAYHHTGTTSTSANHTTYLSFQLGHLCIICNNNHNELHGDCEFYCFVFVLKANSNFNKPRTCAFSFRCVND